MLCATIAIAVSAVIAFWPPREGGRDSVLRFLLHHNHLRKDRNNG